MGISSFDGARPWTWEIETATGIIITTIGVLLMNAESTTTLPRARMKTRVGLVPPSRMNCRESHSITPVRISPAEIANIAATVWTAGLAKPARAVPGSATPVSMIESTANSATRSGETISRAKSTSVPSTTASTTPISKVNSMKAPAAARTVYSAAGAESRIAERNGG